MSIASNVNYHTWISVTSKRAYRWEHCFWSIFACIPCSCIISTDIHHNSIDFICTCMSQITANGKTSRHNPEYWFSSRISWQNSSRSSQFHNASLFINNPQLWIFMRNIYFLVCLSMFQSIIGCLCLRRIHGTEASTSQEWNSSPTNINMLKKTCQWLKDIYPALASHEIWCCMFQHQPFIFQILTTWNMRQNELGPVIHTVSIRAGSV